MTGMPTTELVLIAKQNIARLLRLWESGSSLPQQRSASLVPFSSLSWQSDMNCSSDRIVAL